MNQGRQRLYLRIEDMEVDLNGLSLHPVGAKPLVEVELLYEPAIKATEDEPGCEEYVELLHAFAVGNSYFENDNRKVLLTLHHNFDMINIITDYTRESIYNQIAEINKRENER